MLFPITQNAISYHNNIFYFYKVPQEKQQKKISCSSFLGIDGVEYAVSSP